jgi:hypothetical protein
MDFEFMSNPYQPSTTEYDAIPPSPGQRSSIAMIFGILNLCFGALGIFGTCAGGALLAFVPALTQMAEVQEGPELQIIPEGPMFAFFVASIVLGGILAIVLIVAGVGLMKYKNWGRTLSIAYAWLNIVFTIISTIASVGVAINKATENGLADQEKATQIGSAVGGSIGGCIGLIYPIVLLIFMYNRNLRNSLD